MKKYVKKIVAIWLMLFLIILVSGCRREYQIVFSEYYHSAENYSELESLINEYYEIVRDAYNNSDRENLDSFVLPKRYGKIFEKIKAYKSKEIMNLQEGSPEYIKMEMIWMVMAIDTRIYERDLAIKIASEIETDRCVNSQWFVDFNRQLEEIVDTFQTIEKP